ncbi:MAG: hypothetical protein ACKVXR_03365 [Planctomycetota bacterium]
MRLTRLGSLVPIAILLLSPASGAAPGGVAVFENLSGSIGTVQVYDELTGAPLGGPAQLAGIRLLEIDFSDRSTLTEFLPGRPRLRQDIPGASRIALPKSRGSLYRYARPLQSGGEVYGFFRVAADGVVQPLLEQPGIGPGGTTDPFVPRVAIAPLGDAFLCSTKPGAGGNLLEIRFAGSPSVVDRTATSTPLRFSGTGLALLPTFGVAAHSRGVLRFDRATLAEATAVSTSPDPLPAWFSGQVVSSRNGQWVATTAGSSDTALHVYAVGSTGAARRASATPQTVQSIGTLPEEASGPNLAISDDGALCAWRVLEPTPVGATRECFVGRTQPLPGEMPERLSSDQNFLDTLDEVGLFHFRPTGKLLIAVGERATPPETGVEKADLFEVTLPTGGPASFLNLTMSSGDATVPFDAAPPTLKIQRATLLPDESAVVLFDDAGSAGNLLAVRPGQSGSQTILSGVKSLDLLEIVTRKILFAVHRDGGAEPEELYRVSTSLGSPPTLIASVPDGSQFVRPAARRDGWISYVTLDSSGERLGRVQLLSGSMQSFPGSPTAFGPSFGYSGLGSLVFSIGPPPSPAAFATWPLNGSSSVMLQAPSAPGFVLPGI